MQCEPIIEPALVSLVDGIPTTTSLLVAETFGKRHDHVMRGIHDLMDKCPKEFTDPNFGASEYTDNTGRKLPMYLLTRDGLTLLVMGYTGKEAMKFKLKYIEAFNAMEAKLKGHQKDDRLSTVEDRRALNTIVHTWAQASRQKYSMCWKQVNSAFNLEKAAEFPARWIPDAVAWVQAKIDALEAPAPELPARAPKLPAIALDLTRTDAISFDELSDALRSIVMRLERACCSMPPREYTKGCKAFSRIAEGDTSLDCVIQALIVGPRYATLDLLKTALTMAEKAQRTHALVCEAGRG